MDCKDYFGNEGFPGAPREAKVADSLALADAGALGREVELGVAL
ncbi:hypothetical protein SBV1_820027 [Verrucomicrobia bacterium]|nr:hypothetical protein SBV1_820027 [Verrucomicrobiota bacterium]